MNKVFKKAVSLVIAAALVIAVLPAMSLASAAEIGETTTFVFTADKINGRENNNSLNDGRTEISMGALEQMSSYVEIGAVDVDVDYYRHWSFWGKYINNNTNGSGGITKQHGIYYDIGSDGRLSSWFALKIKGIEAGTYNVKMGKDSSTKKGCNWTLYILDPKKFSADDKTSINTALNSLSEGVQKVGTVDVYGSTDTELEFGNVSLSGIDGEYIALFRAETVGALDGIETAPTNSSGVIASRTYFAIKSLSFIPTTAAKNADVFGNTAAFIEHTDGNNAMLYLVSAIDSLNYNNVGFEVKVGEEAKENLDTQTVYDMLTMTNADSSTKEFTAADFGLSGKYLYVVSKNIGSFTGQTVQFKPFAVKGDTTTEGSTYQVKLKSN